MANWLSRLPKPLYVFLLIILLPIVGVVDGIAYLTGKVKLYPNDTLEDQMMRAAHNTRNIEIGHGLMNLSWAMQMLLFYVIFFYVFIFSDLFVIAAVYGGVTVAFTIFVFIWSANHRVDPEKARRDFGNKD